MGIAKIIWWVMFGIKKLTESQYAARYDGAMMKLRLAWEAMDGPAKGRFEQKCKELNVPFAEPITGAELAAQQAPVPPKVEF